MAGVFLDRPYNLSNDIQLPLRKMLTLFFATENNSLHQNCINFKSSMADPTTNIDLIFVDVSPLLHLACPILHWKGFSPYLTD